MAGVDELVAALRSGKIAEVRRAVKADPKAARHARAVGEAARLAFLAAFEVLVPHGTDVNAVWRGYRPLHSLLREDAHKSAKDPSAERLACLDWLLAHGADPELPAAWPPARALIVAAFVGSPVYVARLRAAGAWGSLEFAELAMAHGAKPDAAVADKQPLVNNLIRWGQMQPALWLLAHGAGPNIPDERGWTAVHQAVSRGNEQMVRALVEAGGDVTRKDKEGVTPVELAHVMRRLKLLPILKAGAGA